MKNYKITSLFMLFVLAFSTVSMAQLNTPRGSQMATVSQRIGVSDVSITYSRPSVKGREVWGKLVPYGYNYLGFGTSKQAPWRAGANENTTITFSNDATVEGQPIKAGTYGFHVAVKPDNTATLIFSNDANAWGSYFYDQSKDALRVDINTTAVTHHELLTYKFDDVEANSATAMLAWEKKGFPFKVAFDVASIAMADFRDKFKGQAGFQRQNWEQAARFALNNGGDLNEALSWVDAAISGQFFSEKTFNNVALKAQILNKMGKPDEYVKLMDEAATMANTRQLNTLGYQMLNAKDYNRALKYFKQNVANNPENANCYDSLGEAYKTMGDKKNAIKNLKKSLSLNPPANVKANSEKLLKELGAL